MIRTQIYLTEEEKSGLESIASTDGISQSEVIRQAIDIMLKQRAPIDKSALIDNLAGIWADKKDIPDIRTLRSGWRTRAYQ